MRHIVVVLLLAAMTSPVMGQGGVAGSGGNTLIGKWTGKWLSAGKSRASGDMEMEILLTDADRVTGQVTFTTAATPPCSREWQQYVGRTNAGKVSARVDLQGRCGKVDFVFWIDPNEKDVLTGTYTGEYPDKGSIRLIRQKTN
jgi:hypothetical protein